MRSGALLAVILGLAGGAAGHDLYLMPERFVAEPGTVLGIAFENGDGFPEGEAPVAPERLRDTRLISRAGTEPFTGVIAEKRRTRAAVRVPGSGIAILTARTLPRFLELPPEKFEAYLEHEHLTDILAWRREHGESGKPGRELYSKYVKSLVRAGSSDGFWSERAGLLVEFIPEADPYSLRPGDALPVRLLMGGAPAAGVAVESAWLEKRAGKTEFVGRTAADGRIRVPLRAPGPHRLHAIIMRRCDDTAKADWESFWATLTFSVSEKR